MKKAKVHYRMYQRKLDNPRRSLCGALTVMGVYHAVYIEDVSCIRCKRSIKKRMPKSYRANQNTIFEMEDYFVRREK